MSVEEKGMGKKDLFQRYGEILEDFRDLLTGEYRDPNRPLSRAVGFQGLSRPRVLPLTPGAQRYGKEEEAVESPAELSREQRLARLEELERVIRSCDRCLLAQGRNHAVPGIGVMDPLVLVVGEGPGAEEDQQGLPFVGPAGQFLDKWLAAVGLSRHTNVYITNVVKCRPPGNRDPRPEETTACFPYLLRQVEWVRPKAVLAVGRIAAQLLLQTNRGIGGLRGTVHQWKDLPLVATYHPSAVLRDMSLKRPVWEDMKRLKSLLDQLPG